MAGRILRFEFTFDTPIVWHIHITPFCIAESRLLGMNDIAEMKFPLCIKIYPAARLGTRPLRKRATEKQQNSRRL